MNAWVGVIIGAALALLALEFRSSGLGFLMLAAGSSIWLAGVTIQMRLGIPALLRRLRA